MDSIETYKKLLEGIDNIEENDKRIFLNVLAEVQKSITDKILNYKYFSIPTGKVYGDYIESEIIRSFKGFTKAKVTNYDADYEGLRIEIKSIRALKKGENESLIERILNKGSEGALSSPSFPQVKPSYADWFILHAIYGDGERIFLLPSKIIQSKTGNKNKEEGKIFLAIQHSNNPHEGQINYNEILKYADIFELKDYKHLGNNDIKPYMERITEKLTAMNYCLK